MTKTFSLLFFFFFLVSCNKDAGQDCATTANADGTTEETCTDTSTTPTEPEAPATTTGGTSGGTTGSTTGGTTGSTTGGTTGSTTGGTTGSTTGGTTGSTTGGTTPPPPPVSDQALDWSADIYFVNFSAAQESKVDKAVSLMKKVIASKTFKDKIINHTYNGKKTFVDNNGLTNTQIYQKLLDGAEKMGNTSKNNTMDVELELYYAATSTVGYTYPNSTRIWMNTKYFNNYTPIKVAGNLTHEWLHKLGFGHASSYSTSRNYSVPYAIGYLMEELAENY